MVKISGTAIEFTPSANFIGTAGFTYVVADPGGLTSTRSVTIEVIPPTGTGPVAKDDVTTIRPGEADAMPVLANDSHPDGLPFSLAGPPVVRRQGAGGQRRLDRAHPARRHTDHVHAHIHHLKYVYGRTSSST